MAKNYNCSNCREAISADGVKKIAVGQDRYVVFCGECNCYVALEEPKGTPAPTKSNPAA